jgi:hypothetical protein
MLTKDPATAPGRAKIWCPRVRREGRNHFCPALLAAINCPGTGTGAGTGTGTGAGMIVLVAVCRRSVRARGRTAIDLVSLSVSLSDRKVLTQRAEIDLLNR